MSNESYIDPNLISEIASKTNIISGDMYRQMICGVAQVASDMVSKTLGPYGSTTIVDEGAGFTYPTKDGWACLSKLVFADPVYNAIYNVLKKISFNSVTTVGDGTTTAMVAANNFLQYMYNDLIPFLDNEDEGFRQADFLQAVENITAEVERRLIVNPNIKRINVAGDFREIYDIAYIATNGNAKFAEIIQELYQKTLNPNIQVTLDKGATTTYELQKGYKFNARVLNFPVYVNSEGGEIRYDSQPRMVVIFDHNVTFQMHEKIITKILKYAQIKGEEIVIMAPYFDDILTSAIDSQIQTLIQNHQVPNVMLVQVPVTMDLHRKSLGDLAVITNAQIFDDGKVRAFNILHHNETHDPDDQIEDDQMSISSYSFNNSTELIERCIGTIVSMVLTKSEGFIQDYDSIAVKEKLAATIEDAKEDYFSRKKEAESTVGGTLDKDYLFCQLRYIKLLGNTGIIKVGALTDIQRRCDKDAIDDAVLACRSAYENGYVRGMNLELLSILNTMLSPDETANWSPYEIQVISMLYKCFYETSLQVIRNKVANDNIRRRITELELCDDKVAQSSYNMSNEEVLQLIIGDPGNYDYNLRTEVIHSDGLWEVTNSAQTDIEILRAVVNVLTTVITSNQFLSTNYRFDPASSDQRMLDKRLHEDKAITENKVSAILSALHNKHNSEMFKDLLTIRKHDSDDSMDWLK